MILPDRDVETDSAISQTALFHRPSTATGLSRACVDVAVYLALERRAHAGEKFQQKNAELELQNGRGKVN